LKKIGNILDGKQARPIPALAQGQVALAEKTANETDEVYLTRKTTWENGCSNVATLREWDVKNGEGYAIIIVNLEETLMMEVAHRDMDQSDGVSAWKFLMGRYEAKGPTRLLTYLNDFVENGTKKPEETMNEYLNRMDTIFRGMDENLSGPLSPDMKMVMMIRGIK